MATKSSRFDLDWWIVSKRHIYIVVAAGVLLLVAAGFGVYAWLYGNPFRGVAAAVSSVEGARFDTFEGGVRVTRAATRETFAARSDTQLFPGDIVQTAEDGRARIALADGSTLLIKPNSVITIAENKRSDGDGRTSVRVAVDRGYVNVRTEQREEGTSNVVKTPLTENELASQTSASFGVREDKTEEIRVSTGAVETSTSNGQRTTFTNGEFALVNQQANIAQRERLLDTPQPAAPRNLERLAVPKGGAAEVTLRWQRPSGGSPLHYRVEVATSPFFVPAGKVIERDQLQSNAFTVDDLHHGNYFWRVRAFAPSGQASEWSDPQKFSVVTEGGGGEQISFGNVSVEHVGGQIYIVRGQTQPGTTVRSAGRQTLAGSDGGFQLQVPAPRGARDITLDAEGAHGGRTTQRFPLQQ